MFCCVPGIRQNKNLQENYNNNRSNLFLHSAFYNNHVNALYISALVIGPKHSCHLFSSLGITQPRSATTLQRLFQTQNQPLPSRYQFIPLEKRVCCVPVRKTNFTLVGFVHFGGQRHMGPTS